MTQKGDDRRRYPRSRRGVSALIDESGPGVMNHIDNISANGVLCHTVKPLPLMTKMRIALDLPGSDDGRIECEGIVVRCEPHEVGDDKFKVAILYTKISDDARELIEEFVASDIAHVDSDE